MPLPGIYASQISGHLTPPIVGAYDALTTVTVPSGGVASIYFGNIPNTYKHLQVRMISRATNASYYSQILFEANSYPGYYRHLVLADGVNTPPGAYGYTGQPTLNVGYLAGANALTNVFGAAILDIYDYANQNKYKTVRAIGGASNNSTASPDTYLSLVSGTLPSLEPITELNFFPEFGNFAQYTTISLYGVK